MALPRSGMRPQAIAFETRVAESDVRIRSMYNDLHVDMQMLKITTKIPSFQDIMLPGNSIELLDSRSIKRTITIVQNLNSGECSKSVMGTRKWHRLEWHETELGRFVWSILQANKGTEMITQTNRQA